MPHQEKDHPLSFLTAAFDAKDYPDVSVSFGQNREGKQVAWIKQARPAVGEIPSRPDVFHSFSAGMEQSQLVSMRMLTAFAGVNCVGCETATTLTRQGESDQDFQENVALFLRDRLSRPDDLASANDPNSF